MRARGTVTLSGDKVGLARIPRGLAKIVLRGARSAPLFPGGERVEAIARAECLTYLGTMRDTLR